MDPMLENRYLKIPPGAVENIRKMYDLDKPDRIDDAVKLITEWILKQDHIIKKDFSNEYLERTLIQCKGSVEKAKKQIDRLCTMKTLVPRFFWKTNAKMVLKNVLDIVWLFPLPTPTEDYYRIIIYKFNNYKNITTERIAEHLQYAVILCEYLKAHDYMNGLILISDHSKLNLIELIPKLNIVELQQFASILFNGYNARVKGSYILTDSNAVDLLMKIINKFVPEKVSKRTYVKKTLEDLHKVVPKELLPIEYGGNERSIEELHEKWIEELSSEEHVEYMRMMNKACTDETKRLEGTFDEEYMGMPGSFRCLSVD